MSKTDAEIIAYESGKTGEIIREVNEHPWAIRFTHWLNTVSLFILIGSGLRIFLAFPSFGPKIPQENFFLVVPKSLTIGGWLAGALQWHFTFMWIYLATGVVYLGYQFTSGHYKRVLFTHKDIPGILPMVKHYFLFRSKPELKEQYNPLQKLAYTSAVVLGILSVLTGFAIYKPAQFSSLTNIMGGFGYARIWHHAVMWALILFVIGHVVMVVIHGWNNFVSMLTGWKREPEYLPEPVFAPPVRDKMGTEEETDVKATDQTVGEPNETDTKPDNTRTLEEKRTVGEEDIMGEKSVTKEKEEKAEKEKEN